MRLAWLGILLLWPLAALAQALDPQRLGAQDTRFLQAALVWSGDYVGLTDGDWGERSEAALDAALSRSGGDPLPVLLAFIDEVATGGWATLNLDGRLTVALPTSLLILGPGSPDQLEYRSPDDSLVFRVFFDGPEDAWAMHDWMLGAHAGREEPYHSVRGDRWVTAVTLDNRKEVYLRSALIDGFVVSMQVVNDPWQDARANLISSSMQWGSAPDLVPAPGGALERLLLAPPPVVPEEPPAMASLPEVPALPTAPAPVAKSSPVSQAPAVLPTTGLVGTGTGFFVNNTDLVTAAHVIEGCRELRLEDGSALAVLAADPILDLAVLSAGRRSAHWLPLGAPEGPRLGQPVLALGFPLHGSALTANQGLSVTSGNVSALPRVADTSSRIAITTPVQPGNSGGPLLSQAGAVEGVVVARADDLVALEIEGVLPQNMNQATSVAQLVPFLEGAGVLFPSAAHRPAQDLSQGIPDEVQAAVVLIGCY